MTDLFPIGARFQVPGLGTFRIINYCVDQGSFLQDKPQPFDYVVRVEGTEERKLVTHELFTNAMGVERLEDKPPFLT